jgi:hypothetical protein
MTNQITRIEIFEGKEKDERGKEHNIKRETCLDCGEIISLEHRGCCGYILNGSSRKHICKGSKPETKKGLGVGWVKSLNTH